MQNGMVKVGDTLMSVGGLFQSRTWDRQNTPFVCDALPESRIFRHALHVGLAGDLAAPRIH